MNDSPTRSRRQILQAGVAAAGIALAGCLGDDGAKVDTQLTDEDFPVQFDASEGDEYTVTIVAEDSGADVGVIPSEATASFGDEIGWGWHLDSNEEVTDEIEIPESESYSVWVTDGEAHVTIE